MELIFMKKNIILESYRKLFFQSFDHTRIPKEYIYQLVDDAINNEFQDGYVLIGGYKLTPSDCLKKVDPLAYEEYFDKYCYSQDISQNDDGTYYDHMQNELGTTHETQDNLIKECCHCCGQEFLKQELCPDTGYCIACQEDQLVNGPKQFRILPTDTQTQIIIKETCMKKWKKSHK